YGNQVVVVQCGDLGEVCVGFAALCAVGGGRPHVGDPEVGLEDAVRSAASLVLLLRVHVGGHRDPPVRWGRGRVAAGGCLLADDLEGGGVGDLHVARVLVLDGAVRGHVLERHADRAFGQVVEEDDAVEPHALRLAARDDGVGGVGIDAGARGVRGDGDG